MASKQFLRRLPLLGRERLNQLSGGAFPDVANDVLPIVSGGAADTHSRSQQSPAPVSVSSRTPQKPGLQTLGQWSQPITPHLRSLQKPLSTLGITPAVEASRAAWPVPPDAGKQASPTDIALTTLPAIAGLLKHKRPLSARALEVFEEGATSGASTVVAPKPLTAATDESGSAADAATKVSQQEATPQLPPHQFLSLPHQRRSITGRSTASSSILLNKLIMACRSTEELLSLVQHRGGHFDYFNISTALARVPKLVAASNSPQLQHPFYMSGPMMPPSQSAAGAVASQLGAGGGSSAAMPSDVHVDAAGRAVLDLLSQLMVTHINNFDARGLANSAWAFGKLKYVPSGSLPSVIAQAALRLTPEFSPQNLSNLVWSFVYMHHADEALLTAASRFVCARVEEFKPQELANIVWAFASLGHRDDQMLQVVAQRAQQIAPQFKEQELSNVLWALGKMSLRGRPDVFESLMAETRAKLPAFLPQGISNIAWALASVGHADVLFLDLVVAQCSRQLAAFDVQALANLAWAMASLGYYQPPFMATIVNECLGRGLDRLSPQNLSNILWSCATLNHRDPRMLAAWAAQTLEKLASFEPQGLSNTAWAFARLGFHDQQLFAALGAAALHKLEGFTSQGLSNLAWAMATAGSPQPRLFEALSRRAVALAPAFNVQNCSVTLWAAATLRHYDERLFGALLERLVDEMEADGCEPQNVANALWAVARMGHPLPASSAGAMVRHAVRLLPRMSQQELCNTMWAVASLDLMDESLFAAFTDCLQRLPDISPEGMHQAYHAQLMFHSNLARAAGVPLSELQELANSTQAASLGFPLLPRLPEPLQTVAASMWAASARDAHLSRFQQEVSGALAVAGVPHALEWMTDDQHFSVDIGLQVNAQPTAVEVNGSHHYASNPPHRPLADMDVRRRLLQDRGWHVVDVGVNDWETLGRTVSERGSNLVGRIAASLDDWDWRFVGLPQRAPGAVVPPPQAVVQPAQTSDATSSLQQQQEQAALQQALIAAMGLGPAFADSTAVQAQAAAASAPAGFVPAPVSVPAGPGLGFDLSLDMGLGAAANWASQLGLGQAATSNASTSLAAERAGIMGLGVTDADAVTAALEAAEALRALPGGNLLLAQQMYEVLGVSLPSTAAELQQLSAQGGVGAGFPLAHIAAGAGSLGLPHTVSQRSSIFGGQSMSAGSAGLASLGGLCSGSMEAAAAEAEEMLVNDEDLERVVRYALA